MTNNDIEGYINKNIIQNKDLQTDKKIAVIEEERAKVLARLQKAAEDDERKEALAESKKVKSLAEILADQDKPIEVYIETIDAKIKFCKLAMQEWIQFQDMELGDKLKTEVVFRMMNKADPSVTKEQVYSLPLDVIEEISEEMDKKAPFLSQRQWTRLVLSLTLSYLDSLLLYLKTILASEKKTLTDTVSTSFPGSTSPQSNQDSNNLTIPG